jgi:Siphovirus Gp157
MAKEQMNELYKLTGQLGQLKDMIAFAENKEEMEKMLEDTIEATEETIGEEVEGLIAIQREYEAEAEKFKREKEYFDKKERELKAKAETVKAFMAQTLAFMGIDHKNKRKITTKFGNVGFQKNPPQLEIVDESKIPMEYEIIPQPEFDKKSMLADLKDRLTYEEQEEGKKKPTKKQLDELLIEEWGVKLVNNNSHLRIR